MNLAITQGRLSPPVDNKIQSFPINTWENEFKIANEIGIKNIEWVIDYETVFTNPIFNEKGINRIVSLCKKYKISVSTIQCDFLLHKPFWKKKYKKYYQLINEKINYLLNIKKLGKNMIFIVPILENSKISNKKEERFVIDYFKSKTLFLRKNNNKIAFEIDYNPKKLKKFISNFHQHCFGINYDTGNSISNNYSYNDEIKSYFNRVLNIHYKDKNNNNKTVYLGEGKFIYPDFYNKIKNKYRGLITLQAARSGNISEIELIKKYKEDLENSKLNGKLNIGIMQGRTKNRKKYNICPKNWIEEFVIANRNKFSHIEMIVDKKLSKHNPIIREVELKTNNLKYSINLDYFVHNKINEKTFMLFDKILKYAQNNNFKLIVLPLIEKSKLNKAELKKVINKILIKTRNCNIKIALELDDNFDVVLKSKSENIGICYDIGNLSKTRDIYDDVYRFKKKIIHFHFKDFKKKYRSNFERGNINFCKLIGIIKKINYKGRITFEGLSGIKNNIINKKYLERIL